MGDGHVNVANQLY